MSRIPFLDNVYQGKNDWWRYALTIILTWGVPQLLGIAIVALDIFYSLFHGNFPINPLDIISNPLISIAFVGLTAVISVTFLYIGVRFIHRRKFISIINTDSKFSWRRLLKGGIVWLSILSLGTVLALIFEPTSLKFTFNANLFIILLILSLLVFPIQASFEELFFRGYLMQMVGLKTKLPVIPLIVTSVIFAALHYFNGANTLMSVDIVLQILIIGITLGIIALGENRIETAMGVHIANNIFVSLVVNSPDAYSQNLPSLYTSTGAPDPLMDTLILAIYAAVLLVIIFWGKKENVLRIFRKNDEFQRAN